MFALLSVVLLALTYVAFFGARDAVPDVVAAVAPTFDEVRTAGFAQSHYGCGRTALSEREYEAFETSVDSSREEHGPGEAEARTVAVELGLASAGERWDTVKVSRELLGNYARQLMARREPSGSHVVVLCWFLM